MRVRISWLAIGMMFLMFLRLLSSGLWGQSGFPLFDGQNMSVYCVREGILSYPFTGADDSNSCLVPSHVWLFHVR